MKESNEVGERHVDPTVRLTAYINLVHRLMDEIAREKNLAPVIIACVRGLRFFPEYRDSTVMLLDEIEVIGISHFDQLLRRELTALADHLLELNND